MQLREQPHAKVVEASAALYALLSEDELLWLELRQHEQCAPFLDGYRPKLSDNDNWNRRDSEIVDREDIPLDEIERYAKLEHERGASSPWLRPWRGGFTRTSAWYNQWRSRCWPGLRV